MDREEDTSEARAVRLASVASQAAGFTQVRRANQREQAEDYVELIADLIDAQGEARLTELAQRLGVTHATAAKTVQRLCREGLVETKPYRSIFLTDEGRRIAEISRRRHAIVLGMLIAIGVDPETAAIDAEGIEHHVSEATLAAFARLIEPKE